MKRVAAAIILLAIAAGIALWSGYIFESRLSYFEKQLSEMLDAPDEELPERAEEIVASWKKYAVFLRSVFAHDGIDELERLVISLPMTLNYSGREDFISNCVEGINLIKNLKACEKLTLENVL